MTDEIPPSLEQLVEHARRIAVDLDDYAIDEQLAVATARRNVAAAHGRHASAATWQEVALALDDVRRSRARFARDIEAMTSPIVVVRPLTADELGDDEEPTC